MAHKLLLADDSITIQRVIELTFAGEDVQVLTASDGEEAIARVQADRPDIVLADIGMPKRSGYEVAAFIKAQSELAHIPVLLLTGAFEPVDEGRAKAAGCNGVLVKPFEPQHVIARVRELLHDRQRTSTAGGGSATPAVADVPRPVERLAPHRGAEGQEHLAASRRETGARQNLSGSAPAEGARGAGADALDDYFDRLDAAFATITPSGPDKAKPIEAESVLEPEVIPRHERAVGDQELDRFDQRAEVVPPRRLGLEAGPMPSTSPADVPTTFANPPAASLDWPAPSVVEGTTPTTVEWGMRQPQPPPREPADLSPTITSAPEAQRASWAPSAPVVRATPAVPAAQAPIADAFSALLALEEGEPGARAVRLIAGPSSPEITDELVDEITRRVMERLAPKAATDVVSDIVGRVAERLVREEIARIRTR